MNTQNYNSVTIKQAWTRDMLLQLRDVADQLTLHELMTLFNRGENAIKKKCVQVGVKYKREQ